MAKDHYLPASLIGRFSAETIGTARGRPVFVARKGKPSVFRTKAQNVGYVNGLYDIEPKKIWGDQIRTSVDPGINGYEDALPQALDQLDRADLMEISTWLRVLVPYVASLFVRGHDFIPRFMARPVMMAAGDLNTQDNANEIRSIELERLLAPVCCARWVVLHKSGGEPFVLNDLGLAGTLDKSTGEYGWAVPICSDSLIGIFPQQQRAVARYRSGLWMPIIEHVRLDPVEASSFNDSMAYFATSLVMGANREVVERTSRHMAKDPAASESLMQAWPFDHKMKLAHALDWHRLVAATANNPEPSEIDDFQAIDWAALRSRWCPPVGLVINAAREFPTGLSLAGNLIRLRMDIPSDYDKHFMR